MALVKRSIPVTIAGQHFYLRSDAAEEHVHRVAKLVDERYRRVQRTTRQVATHKVAILTALQFADELMRERQARAELRRRVRERCRRLLELLDLVATPRTRS